MAHKARSKVETTDKNHCRRTDSALPVSLLDRRKKIFENFLNHLEKVPLYPATND